MIAAEVASHAKASRGRFKHSVCKDHFRFRRGRSESPPPLVSPRAIRSRAAHKPIYISPKRFWEHAMPIHTPTTSCLSAAWRFIAGNADCRLNLNTHGSSFVALSFILPFDGTNETSAP
ncbi:hypothetical protein PR048_018914 [Dryococelus australis]|uniref:Uncharacterized protein n=1 Tax=Dryococelus australis TaxID=614101 RepID=A0ABQ9H247_9NEOP|nr:hypothetical protein PR048_018914 [Dryococelus australis]